MASVLINQKFGQEQTRTRRILCGYDFRYRRCVYKVRMLKMVSKSSEAKQEVWNGFFFTVLRKNQTCWHLDLRFLSTRSEVVQSCLTLCDPMDCSLSGSSIHGIFQARVLEWVVISFSKGSSWPWDWTQVSCTVGRCFTVWATREEVWNNFIV